jgi:ketosteroid isomerase-like protein
VEPGNPLRYFSFSASQFFRFCLKSIDATFNSGLDDTMKTKPFALSVCFALLSFAFFGTASAADTKSVIKQALRDADAQLSAAAAAKDLDKTVSYYSDDAIVMPPNTSAARTKEAIGNVLKDFLASPGATVTWKATKVEVAKSGDLACVSGIYEEMTIDASGKPGKERGKYLKVWQKQADGKWKCSADIWNSDLPVPVPSGKK